MEAVASAPCPATSDVHVLVAFVRRAALLRMTAASGRHHQGLATGAKILKFSSNWTRKACELDACLGIVEKISPASVAKFLAELDTEIARCAAQPGGYRADDGRSSDTSAASSEELAPSDDRRPLTGVKLFNLYDEQELRDTGVQTEAGEVDDGMDELDLVKIEVQSMIGYYEAKLAFHEDKLDGLYGDDKRKVSQLQHLTENNKQSQPQLSTGQGNYKDKGNKNDWESKPLHGTAEKQSQQAPAQPLQEIAKNIKGPQVHHLTGKGNLQKPPIQAVAQPEQPSESTVQGKPKLSQKQSCA